jgi:hypothetical protein
MKNKFIASIGLLVLLVSTVVFYSCSKDSPETLNNLPSNSKVLELLDKKNNIVKVENLTVLNLLNPLVNKNNENSFFQTKNENEYFIISKTGNKFTLIKGMIENNQYITQNKFELLDNMDDKGNGNYVIRNINEGIELSQIYKDGIILNEIIVNQQKTTATKGFCQRENGESYRACNNRETDEFCDDFVSTVAYITNPTIAILIAGMCSC